MIPLLILAIQIASSSPRTVDANAECPVTRHIVYKIKARVLCVTPDVIFRNGYEEV